jgi:hypothetical protein
MANKAMKFSEMGSGIKGINFDTWGGIEGFLSASSGGGTQRNQLLRRVNPWLSKATDMTALAVSELPFDILDANGNVIDTSSDWQDIIGGMEVPADLLYNLAASLCLGKAYLIPETTSRMVMSLQYCAPHTVTPMITNQGLEYLTRSTAYGKTGNYWPADGEDTETPTGYQGRMMYFWLQDSDVEIGPAMSYPAGVAQLSVELILGMDATLKIYGERGFIQPTLMSVKGMPTTKDREETQTWYNRFIRGWSDTVAKLINAESMTITKVGATIEEIANGYPPLTRQAIENIGTAYGIPAALFMSDAAFASEMNALTKVWYTTGVFRKIYHCIEYTFNTQLLNQFGWKMKFKPETLDAFQENEQMRSASFSTYVTAGIAPSIAAQMVGMELPEGITFDMLDPKPVQAEPAPVVDQGVGLNAEMVKDMNLWRQVAVKRFRKGLAPAVDWECKALPNHLADGIRERLREAMTEVDILASFEVREVQPQPDPWLDAATRLTSALESLKSAEVEVKAEPAQPVNVAAPNVTVTIPDQPTPAVNVTLPDQPTPNVTVNNNLPPSQSARVIRDITGAHYAE